jgi:magnesium chelatase family protein
VPITATRSNPAPALVTKYQKRISGPLLDYIDIHIELPRVDYEKLSSARMGETSESIRKRVQAARNIQQQHFASSQSDIICNADMRVGEIQQFCKLQDESQHLIRAAMTQLNLSARAYHRILKLARTRLWIWRGAKQSNPRIWRRRCTLRSRLKLMMG